MTCFSRRILRFGVVLSSAEVGCTFCYVSKHVISMAAEHALLACQTIGRSVLAPTTLKCSPIVCAMQVRYPTTKHYEARFRILRRKKVLKMDLPDFGKILRESKLPPDEMREKMKKDKQLPPRVFQERPINISCTGAIFEAFVPPEGDGKASIISREGVKQKSAEFGKKGKSYLETRKVRQYEDGFDTKEFAQIAQDITIEAQKCLENMYENQNRLHEIVTERALPEMVFGLQNKTFRWKFVESVEPPRVMHVRTTEILGKDNLYAQVTVRMHTKQILAIYDRFGRLMYGSETLAKDCLEYVVFEKHIANTYGQWRIHGKIIPDWLPPREPVLKTYRKPVFQPLDVEKTKDLEIEKKPEETASKETVGLAT